MKKDFIPVKISKIDYWEKHFSDQLVSLAPTLNIDPTQVTSITQEIDDHRTAYSEADLAKKAAKAKVAQMQRLKTQTLRSIRKLVRQIKASPAYTESIGKSMGIIGPEDSKELTEPTLRVRSIGGRAVISYKKYRSDGIYLYSRRGHETALVLLAADNRSPYVDTRPNLNPSEPEQREYAAYYMLNDEPVGKMGSIHLLLVAPEPH
jgi:hypothetical protein